MKSKKYIWSAILVFLIPLILPGCGRKEAEYYGQKIATRDVTNIDAILKEPGSFDGKTVTVEGKIIRECPTGCWFDLKENSGVIYVDLNPSGFAIPQKVGKKIVVEGKVKVQNNRAEIIGEGVEIK